MLWAAQSIFTATLSKVKPQLQVLILWLLIHIEIHFILSIVISCLQDDGVLVGLDKLIWSQLCVILDATVCSKLQHFFDYFLEYSKVLLIIKKSQNSHMKQRVT